MKDKTTNPDPGPNPDPPTINIGWSECLGGNSDDRARSFQQTADTGYMLMGTTLSSDGDFSSNHGGGDAWVVKLDASFDISWHKCLGVYNNYWNILFT